MLRDRLFRLRTFLIMLLAVICFLDLAVTYFALKGYNFFLESNPISEKFIQAFGLELAVLLIMPVVHIGVFLIMYYAWGFLYNEQSKVGVWLVSGGILLALLWRFLSLCWNFREFYRTFI